MRPFPSRSTAAALLAALSVAACGRAPQGVAEPAPRPAAAGASATPATVRGPFTAADVHFMTAMIGHHAQAIEMSQLAATHGASASVRTLAERIINAQQDEIATMQLWLRDRGEPAPEVTPTGAVLAHGGGHHAHHASMPGMLTADQMERLDRARGAEFDRLFLTFMIQHHRGAVDMVRELIGSYGAAQDDTVFKLASDVNVDQSTEIARMQRMLADLILASPSP